MTSFKTANENCILRESSELHSVLQNDGYKSLSLHPEKLDSLLAP